MAHNSNSKFTVSYLDSLSLLESNAAVLYTALADRVKLDSAKSTLLEAAGDSQKNSLLLKGAGEKLAKPREKPNGCAKIEEVFNLTYTIYKDIIAKDEISIEELLAMVEKLSLLEKVLSDKYLFVQSKTQKLKVRHLNPLQEVSLDNLGSLFARMMNDCEKHRKLLDNIKEFVEKTLSPEEPAELASCVAPVSLEPPEKQVA
jgi:hypothetical protein